MGAASPALREEDTLNGVEKGHGRLEPVAKKPQGGKPSCKFQKSA